MRNYIPITDILARDPKWADRLRAREKSKTRRYRADPNKRARNMFLSVRSEAKRKGVEFDLTIEWFEARLKAGVCELSGLGFDLEQRGLKTAGPNAPSVDRRISGGHYTAANCRMVLFSLNRALSNWGEDYVLNVFWHVLAKRDG